MFLYKIEEIPFSFIIQKEIEKAFEGKPFFANDRETGKPIRLQAVKWEDFLYYYNLWEDFDYFNLPQGKGYLHERRWYLDFIKVFVNANRQVEFFLEEKAYK